MRSFQRSGAVEGNTVVHVAPGFTLEVSGIRAESANVNGGSQVIEITTNGVQVSVVNAAIHNIVKRLTDL